MSLFLPPSAAICLLKKLLEPDPNKRPNIHQVMADSWLQLANKNTGAPYLNRSVDLSSSTHPWPRSVPKFISVWESAECINPPPPTYSVQDPHRGDQPNSVDAHDREDELQAQRGSQCRPHQPRLSHSGRLLPPQQENEETFQRIQSKPIIKHTPRDVCLDIGLGVLKHLRVKCLNDDTHLNEHCCITGQFCNWGCFYVFRRCSSRKKRREKNKKVSISRPSGGSMWTSSPSPPNRHPSTWPSARGPARKRNTGQVSRRRPQQRKHILTRQIYKRVYLFLFVSYRVG